MGRGAALAELYISVVQRNYSYITSVICTVEGPGKLVAFLSKNEERIYGKEKN